MTAQNASGQKPRVLVLVNGSPGAATAIRVKNIFQYVAPRYEVTVLYRGRSKARGFLHFSAQIRQGRPDIVYCNEISYAGGGAAFMAKILWGVPFILDNDDPVAAVLRNMGRPRAEYYIARTMEALLPRLAEHVVCMGATQLEWFRARGIKHVSYIPNGVDLDRFQPRDSTELRKALGLDEALVVGVVGSLNWSEPLQWCYGREIIEALRVLDDAPIRGLIVGGGSGLDHLERLAERYGVRDRVVFAGTIPHGEVPTYINAMDVCVLTQTNDEVGRLRTSPTKLPEYLACGRYVIATDNGPEFHRLLSEVGHLLPYEGSSDPDYPLKLAEHLRALIARPALLQRAAGARSVAETEYGTRLLGERMTNVLDSVFAKH